MASKVIPSPDQARNAFLADAGEPDSADATTRWTKVFAPGPVCFGRLTVPPSRQTWKEVVLPSESWVEIPSSSPGASVRRSAASDTAFRPKMSSADPATDNSTD